MRAATLFITLACITPTIASGQAAPQGEAVSRYTLNTVSSVSASLEDGDRLPLERSPQCFECSRKRVTFFSPNPEFGAFPMIAYKGLYNAVFVPPPGEWPGEGVLSEDEIRVLVDRLDLIYQYYLDLTGFTPRKVDRCLLGKDCDEFYDFEMTFFFDDPCSGRAGCAGGNLIEISASDSWIPSLQASLGRDVTPQLFIHEMGHTFDSLRGHTHYVSDHAHAYTRFIENYMPYYYKGDMSALFREGGGASYTGAHRALNRIFPAIPPYFESRKGWDACVRNGEQDFDCRNPWAGMTMTYALVFGPEAYRRAMDFLWNYAGSHSPPTSPGGKSDLYVRALAAGAQTNLACFLDRWKWRLTPQLRAELASYGEPECVDVEAYIQEVLDSGPQPVNVVAVPFPETEPWGFVEEARVEGGEVAFATVTEDLDALVEILAPPMEPTHVRFWVSGVGFVGRTEFDSRASFSWRVPEGVRPGRYGYRAQLMHGSVPVSNETSLSMFEIPPCLPGPATACLFGGEFRVEGVMHDFSSPPRSFEARVMSFPGGRAESDQAVFFESFSPGNFEVGVKMVDACGLPVGDPARGFWAFFGGLTNAETLIRVEDTRTGDVLEWSNPRGSFPRTLARTDAFPCVEASPVSPCVRDEGTACLLGGRFRVTGEMGDFSAPPKAFEARVMSFPGGRAESGQAVFFESFSSGNFEIGVKMVDACGLPEGDPFRAYWVFYGGLTNAETEVMVTQTSTGLRDTWTNPRGSFPRSEGRTQVFPCK